MEDTKKAIEEAEQASAHNEPMGSVAGAMPRNAGSAPDAGNHCPPENAPDHEGGHATIVAGEESHIADQPGEHTQKPVQT